MPKYTCPHCQKTSIVEIEVTGAVLRNKKKGKSVVVPTVQDETEEMLMRTFAQFWVLYPRRIDKARTEKAWRKINPSESMAVDILAAVKKQKNGWDDPKYIPHPTTWLNGRRWEDHIDTPKVNGSTPAAHKEYKEPGIDQGYLDNAAKDLADKLKRLQQ